MTNKKQPAIFMLDLQDTMQDAVYLKPPGSKYNYKRWDVVAEEANSWSPDKCKIQMLWSKEEYLRLLHDRPITRVLEPGSWLAGIWPTFQVGQSKM